MSIKDRIRSAEKMMTMPWAIEAAAFGILKSKFELYGKDPNSFIRHLWERGIAQGVLVKKVKTEEETADNKDMEPKGDFLADLFGVRAPSILDFDKKTATIKVIGPLVDVHTCATIVEGFTSFEDISNAIDEAEGTEDIDKVVFKFDSPGGMVSGLDALSQKIKGMEIHTVAEISDMAASAAFWLASQADEIVATSRTAFVGSIGVVIEFWDGSRAMEQAGFDKVQLVSDGAPDKRPDLTTTEGQRKIISRLNDIHKIFVERVATGRGVSQTIVNEKFGKGDIVISEKAIAVNMIDKISVDGENESNTTEKEISVEENVDLKSLLDSNPGAKAEHEAAIKSASQNAVKEALDASEKERKETTKLNLELANKVLLSDEYPKAIKELAVNVVAGEADKVSLETTVNVFDAGKEQENSDAAAKETEETVETPPVVEGKLSTDGSVKTADDAKAAVLAMKN